MHNNQPTSTNTATSHIKDLPLAAGQRPFCDKEGGAVVRVGGKILNPSPGRAKLTMYVASVTVEGRFVVDLLTVSRR